ncbi:predicted dehydrogenase [Chthonomonas calidirosea]|uniref:Gfo/Idh/MocA family protein n=1 Tax=Chthonomonas calidirosea TaxID=454171 RepID=UPI0006DD52A1|nr:Gfo/Idh/MocA family oxidoreductase [Chthonomonas calidirosea]CEK20033.1 predicted dehydrogenase [Chthonomonas calidirosea]
MTRITRRDFLRRTGGGLTTLGLVAQAPSALAQPRPLSRRVAANDKIVIALIGCGGMGNVDLGWAMDEPDVEVAALCDVDEHHLNNTLQNVIKKNQQRTAKDGQNRPAPDTYKDFRRVLERKDIDAVLICTPDHWHALPLIYACEAGKDAYCEKPISHDILEAKAMAGAVKHFQRVVQVGTWQRSTREFVSAVAFVRAGKIGRITSVRAWKTDDARLGHHVSVGGPPAYFDYDFWTGPAQMVPYIPEYTHYNWRWFYNYASGETGDWGVHMMDIGLLAMSKDTDLVMPVEICGMGGKLAHPDDDRTTPDTVYGLMRFKNPDFVMIWRTERDHPDLPDHGTQFVGERGDTVTVWRGGWRVRDAEGRELPKEEAPPTNSHMRNWLNCIKTREQPRSNLASMAQTTIVCHLINASYLAGGETVHWDKERMDIVGRVGRETQSYERPYRKPWTLPIYKGD